MDEELYDSIDSTDAGLPFDVSLSDVDPDVLMTTSAEELAADSAADSDRPSPEAESDASTADDLAQQVAAALDALLGPEGSDSDDQQHGAEEQRKAGSLAHRLTDHLIASDEDEDIDYAPTPFLAGPGCYVDATGVYQRPLPLGMKTERYGKTDEALEKDGHVTVSLWSYDAENEEWSDSGEDQEEVHDSFWCQGLTLPAGVMVKIRHNPENGRWEIVEVPRFDCELSSDLAAGSSTTVQINDDSLTVHAPALMTETISSGKRVKIAWEVQNQQWEVDGRECE